MATVSAELAVLRQVAAGVREAGTLDVRDAGLDDDALCVVAAVLQRAASVPLQSVQLSGNKFGPRGAAALCVALSRPDSQVASLDLHDNAALGDGGAAAIAQLLQSTTALRDLNVAGCGFTSAGAACLGDAVVRAGQRARLQTIVLRTVALPIPRLLEAGTPNHLGLRIKSRRLAPLDIAFIARVASQRPLLSLDVAGSRVTPGGAALLARAAAVNPALTSLKINITRLPIGEMVRGRSMELSNSLLSEVELSLVGSCLRLNPRIQTIDLSGNSIGNLDNGVELLSKALTAVDSRVIHEVYLSANALTTDHVELLVAAIAKGVRRRKERSTPVEHVRLDSTLLPVARLFGVGAEASEDVDMSSQGLVGLVLIDVVFIGAALKHNRVARKLSLANNALGAYVTAAPDCIRRIVSSPFTAVTHLDLRDNRLDDTAVDAVIESLVDNRVLCHVALDGNTRVSDAKRRELTALLNVNRQFVPGSDVGGSALHARQHFIESRHYTNGDVLQGQIVGGSGFSMRGTMLPRDTDEVPMLALVTVSCVLQFLFVVLTLLLMATCVVEWFCVGLLIFLASRVAVFRFFSVRGREAVAAWSLVGLGAWHEARPLATAHAIKDVEVDIRNELPEVGLRCVRHSVLLEVMTLSFPMSILFVAFATAVFYPPGSDNGVVDDEAAGVAGLAIFACVVIFSVTGVALAWLDRLSVHDFARLPRQLPTSERSRERAHVRRLRQLHAANARFHRAAKKLGTTAFFQGYGRPDDTARRQALERRQVELAEQRRKMVEEETRARDIRDRATLLIRFPLASYDFATLIAFRLTEALCRCLVVATFTVQVFPAGSNASAFGVLWFVWLLAAPPCWWKCWTPRVTLYYGTEGLTVARTGWRAARLALQDRVRLALVVSSGAIFPGFLQLSTDALKLRHSVESPYLCIAQRAAEDVLLLAASLIKVAAEDGDAGPVTAAIVFASLNKLVALPLYMSFAYRFRDRKYFREGVVVANSAQTASHFRQGALPWRGTAETRRSDAVGYGRGNQKGTVAGVREVKADEEGAGDEKKAGEVGEPLTSAPPRGYYVLDVPNDKSSSKAVAPVSTVGVTPFPGAKVGPYSTTAAETASPATEVLQSPMSRPVKRGNTLPAIKGSRAPVARFGGDFATEDAELAAAKRVHDRATAEAEAALATAMTDARDGAASAGAADDEGFSAKHQLAVLTKYLEGRDQKPFFFKKDPRDPMSAEAKAELELQQRRDEERTRELREAFEDVARRVDAARADGSSLVPRRLPNAMARKAVAVVGDAEAESGSETDTATDDDVDDTDEILVAAATGLDVQHVKEKHMMATLQRTLASQSKMLVRARARAKRAKAEAKEAAEVVDRQAKLLAEKEQAVIQHNAHLHRAKERINALSSEVKDTEARVMSVIVGEKRAALRKDEPTGAAARDESGERAAPKAAASDGAPAAEAGKPPRWPTERSRGRGPPPMPSAKPPPPAFTPPPLDDDVAKRQHDWHTDPEGAAAAADDVDLHAVVFNEGPLGVSLQNSGSSRWPAVVSREPYGQAAGSTIRVGDAVHSVNGREVTPGTFEDVIDALRTARRPMTVGFTRPAAFWENWRQVPDADAGGVFYQDVRSGKTTWHIPKEAETQGSVRRGEFDADEEARRERAAQMRASAVAAAKRLAASQAKAKAKAKAAATRDVQSDDGGDGDDRESSDNDLDDEALLRAARPDVADISSSPTTVEKRQSTARVVPPKTPKAADPSDVFGIAVVNKDAPMCETCGHRHLERVICGVCGHRAGAMSPSKSSVSGSTKLHGTRSNGAETGTVGTGSPALQPKSPAEAVVSRAIQQRSSSDAAAASGHPLPSRPSWAERAALRDAEEQWEEKWATGSSPHRETRVDDDRFAKQDLTVSTDPAAGSRSGGVASADDAWASTWTSPSGPTDYESQRAHGAATATHHEDEDSEAPAEHYGDEHGTAVSTADPFSSDGWFWDGWQWQNSASTPTGGASTDASYGGAAAAYFASSASQFSTGWVGGSGEGAEAEACAPPVGGERNSFGTEDGAREEKAGWHSGAVEGSVTSPQSSLAPWPGSPDRQARRVPSARAMATMRTMSPATAVLFSNLLQGSGSAEGGASPTVVPHDGES